MFQRRREKCWPVLRIYRVGIIGLTRALESCTRKLKKKFDASLCKIIVQETFTTTRLTINMIQTTSAKYTADQSNLAILVTCLQVLAWNGAAFYSVQETYTSKNFAQESMTDSSNVYCVTPISGEGVLRKQLKMPLQ